MLFNEHIPTDRIGQLANASQRHPDPMWVRLILLGLRVYKRGLDPRKGFTNAGGRWSDRAGGTE